MSDDKRKTMATLLENTRKQLADDPNAHAASVILPVIRGVLPSIIADDILGVQPMSSPYDKKEWPYQVDMLANGKYKDIVTAQDWCRETLNNSEWTNKVQFFAFKTEESYAWFKLRWS